MISQEFLEVMADQGWNGPGAPITPVPDLKSQLHQDSSSSSSSGANSLQKSPLPLSELDHQVHVFVCKRGVRSLVVLLDHKA